MTNDLTIAKGSLLDVANQNKTSLAETFIHADGVVIVDISGSMAQNDSRNGKSRYDVACQELLNLQKNFSGKIAIIYFHDNPAFCPTGILDRPQGGTNLAEALQMARIADSILGFKFFLISDGEPDNEDLALQIASTYQNPIHTIYVGAEMGRGRDFLQKLAHLKQGGVFDTSFRVTESLESKIAGLLKA